MSGVLALGGLHCPVPAGLAADSADGLRWYTKAAENGNVPPAWGCGPRKRTGLAGRTRLAIGVIAPLLVLGREAGPPDSTGEVDAMYNLGLYFLKNESPEGAIKWSSDG